MRDCDIFMICTYDERSAEQTSKRKYLYLCYLDTYYVDHLFIWNIYSQGYGIYHRNKFTTACLSYSTDTRIKIKV
jgi:hypothetical protein